MTETTEAPKHKLRNKHFSYTLSGVSQVALVVKNLAANAGDMRRGFDPWVTVAQEFLLGLP